MSPRWRQATVEAMCNHPDCDICNRLRVERLLRWYEPEGARIPTPIEARLGYIVVFEVAPSTLGATP